MRIDRQALQSPQSADDALRKLHQLRLNGQGSLFKLEWVEGSILMHQKEIPASRRSLPQRPQHRQRATQLPILPQPLQNHHAPAPPKPTPGQRHALRQPPPAPRGPRRPARTSQTRRLLVHEPSVPHLRRHPEPQRNRPTCHPARLADPRRPHPQQRLHSPSPQQPLQHLQPQPRLRPAGPQPQRRRHLARRMQQFTAGLDTLVLTPQRPDGIPQWTLSQNHNLLCHQMARLCHATARTAQEQQWVQRLKNAADNTDPEAAIDAQNHRPSTTLKPATTPGPSPARRHPPTPPASPPTASAPPTPPSAASSPKPAKPSATPPKPSSGNAAARPCRTASTPAPATATPSNSPPSATPVSSVCKSAASKAPSAASTLASPCSPSSHWPSASPPSSSTSTCAGEAPQHPDGPPHKATTRPLLPPHPQPAAPVAQRNRRKAEPPRHTAKAPRRPAKSTSTPCRP